MKRILFLSLLLLSAAVGLQVVEGVSLSLNRELDMITECTPILLKAKALRKMGIIKVSSPSTLLSLTRILSLSHSCSIFFSRSYSSVSCFFPLSRCCSLYLCLSQSFSESESMAGCRRSIPPLLVLHTLHWVFETAKEILWSMCSTPTNMLCTHPPTS